MEEDISRIMEPMDFHPCDTPRGMLYYDMTILTNEQQLKLNTLKIETAREDQKYLAAHPEIRACVALLTRHVLKLRPRTNIHETIAEYFAKSRVDIESDVKEYLAQRGPCEPEATSALNLFPPRESDSVIYYSSSVQEEEPPQESFADKLFDVEEILGDHVMWREQDTGASTSTLEMDLTDSFAETGIQLQPSTSSEIIKSTPHTKPSVTIKEPLVKADRSMSANEDGIRTLGHIPTIEDYDAGYGKRRQTYMSDSQDEAEQLSDELVQYLRDTQGTSGEKVDAEVEDVALEPARVSMLSEELLATLKASKVAPTVSELKAMKSQNVEAHESMKALMEKRSVRISVVPSDQLKEIEDEFQKKRVHTVIKKAGKEPSDEAPEVGKITKVSPTEREKSGDAHALFMGDNSTTDNFSTPNMLFVADNDEEENEGNVESGNDGPDKNAATYETTAEVVPEGEIMTEEDNPITEDTTEENQTTGNSTDEN